MGRLWVKGVVAGVWQGWVGFWWGFGGVRVEAEGGGGAYGGEFGGWVLVFLMCFQCVGRVLTWFLVLGPGFWGRTSIRVKFSRGFEKKFFFSRLWCAQLSSPWKCLCFLVG